MHTRTTYAAITFTPRHVVEAEDKESESWFAVAAFQSQEDAETFVAGIEAKQDGYAYRIRLNTID